MDRSIATEKRKHERRTVAKVSFANIEKMETIEEVKKYLNWEKEIQPLPGDVGKWSFFDDRKEWEERRNKRVEDAEKEKEEKRVAATNPNRDREVIHQFLLSEFLAEQEEYHSSEKVAMFAQAMESRKLRVAPLALYRKLWDKFFKET